MPFSETHSLHTRFHIMAEQVGTSMFTTIWLATWSVYMLLFLNDRHKWAVYNGGQNALNKPHSNQTEAEYTGKDLSLHIPLATLWTYLSSSPNKSMRIGCWLTWLFKEYFEIPSKISTSKLSLKEVFWQDEIKYMFCAYGQIKSLSCSYSVFACSDTSLKLTHYAKNSNPNRKMMSLKCLKLYSDNLKTFMLL